MERPIIYRPRRLLTSKVKSLKKAFRAVVLIGLVLIGGTPPVSAVQSAYTRPQLFFYPPLYRFSDGHHLNSPQTIDVDQATTQFPYIPEMEGVVVMIYWSTLCKTENGCDFSLIKRIIAYWAARDKKIILDVATIGYPIEAPPDGTSIMSATPAWVLQQVKTYRYPARVLGEPQGTAPRLATMPDFRDTRFIALVSGLVKRLSQFDGNPTISQVRVATGLMGEDNPLVGPLATPIQGYREAMWLEFCNQMLKLYLDTFHKTQLEFDIGRLSWMYVKEGDSSKKDVNAFVAKLASHRVFLAFDGLGSASLKALLSHAEQSNGVSRSLFYVNSFRKHGFPAGLEAIGPMASGNMVDTQSIINTIRIVQPEHIVFFNDFPAVVSYSREGDRPTNHTTVRSLSPGRLSTLQSSVEQVLQALGYQ